MYSDDRSLQNLVLMCGVQQHCRPSLEYSAALSRIAAMDKKLQTKRCGVEIQVPIEVLFMKECGEDRSLDEVLKLRYAGEMIRQECGTSLPRVGAGALRCTFVLVSAMKAEICDYRYPLDLDMAKRIDDLVHGSVWFSRVSRSLGLDEREPRPRREIVKHLLMSLFDVTHGPFFKLPARHVEEDNPVTMAQQQLHQTSLTTKLQSLNEWEALRTAAILSQTSRDVKLPYVASLWRSKHWWQWLAYVFFSKRARRRSSPESIVLQYIKSMGTAEIEAFCAILSSESPEKALLACRCEPSDFQDASLAADSPIRWDFDERGEPVLSSGVLTFASPIPFLRIMEKHGESEWVDAIFPGYGRCQVQRENVVLSKQVDIIPALKSLEMSFSSNDSVDISGLPLFLTAVGSTLKALIIDTGEDQDVSVEMVLQRCPKLEKLCLTNRHSDLAVFNFSDYHAAGSPIPAITFKLDDIPAFVQELMSTGSALASCLDRLIIHQHAYRSDKTRRTKSELKRDINALLKIFESKESLGFRLENISVVLYSHFHEYVEQFKRYHLLPINRSVKLGVQNKIAFMSVLSATRTHQREKRGVEKGGNRLSREMLNADVVTTIFQFAATPVLRKVYVSFYN